MKIGLYIVIFGIILAIAGAISFVYCFHILAATDIHFGPDGFHTFQEFESSQLYQYLDYVGWVGKISFGLVIAGMILMAVGGSVVDSENEREEVV